MEKVIKRVQQKVFDVDSRDDVTLYKEGEFEPVESASEFNTRLANDAKTILYVLNAGLEAYFLEQLRANDSIAWQTEDDEGKLQPFTGTTLNETQSKFLAGMVLNMAKMKGYSKDKKPAEKKKLKDEALENVLAIPGFVESLKVNTEAKGDAPTS